jgi:hypothetical protein
MWLHGFGDTAPGTSMVDPNSTEGIVASLAPLVQAGLQAWDQQSIFDFNKSLIESGKAPLTADQMTSLMQGVQPTFNVGLSSNTQQVLTYALLGAGALALFYIFMRREAR